MNESKEQAYPIKYALEKIYTRKREPISMYGDFYFEEVYSIVTKCYIVKEIIGYSKCYDNPMEYFEVVYPYRNIIVYNDLLIDERILSKYSNTGEPKFYSNYKLENSDVVDNVFDTLEEANIARDEANIRPFLHNYEYIHKNGKWELNENLNEARKEFDSKVEACQSFILEHTNDLTISKNKNKTRIRNR